MTENQFRRFAALGYARLVPIVPPDAVISEKSSLAKRKDARGKAVGVKRRDDGLWCGFDWLPYEADAHDLERWHAMGAGLGVKTGQGLLAIDADTLIEDCARTVRDAVERHFGRTPIRIGKFPKALYLIRVDGEYRYTRVDFGDRDEKGNLPNRVEILSDGRQFVAHGIHPGTKQPYHWPRELIPFDDLIVTTPEAIDAFMADLRQLLPAAQPLVREGSATNVNQDALRGDPAKIRSAVEAMINTSDNFPTRENYRDLGYAIKAAIPDNETVAYDIWADWCHRWQDGTNDPDVMASDWNRMKAPFKVGAGKVYQLAEQTSGGKFTQAMAWFDDLANRPENPFEVVREKEDRQAATDLYPLVTISELINRAPPKFLIKRHIVENSVGFLYSEPGVGKTFVSLDMALHIATGQPDWHGDEIGATNAAVLYIASEGSYGFRNRIKAWLQDHAIAESEVKNFYMIEKTINFMSTEDIDRLIRTIRSVANVNLAMVVVDTVSRAIPGADENLQKDMTLFVHACDRVRETFSCAVLGVHHAGKSGDMRGSTVLRGAGDFVFHLARKKGATVGQLECEKMKDAEDGWSDCYSFSVVELGGADVGSGETSLVISRGESNGFGPGVEMTPALGASVLLAMSRAWESGTPWSKAPQSKDRYAVRRMVTDFGFDGVDAEDMLSVWEKMGFIEHKIYSSKSKLTGFYVVGDHGQAVHNSSIFD